MKPLTLFIRTKSFLFFTIILFTSISLVNASNACPVFTNKTAGTNQNDSIQVDEYLIKIISSPNGGYGYNIYQGKKLRIHQPSVPAMQGNHSFITKADAEKIARKVIEKMRNGEALPTITIEELKELNVTNDKKNFSN
jgi:hypothetical protein